MTIAWTLVCGRRVAVSRAMTPSLDNMCLTLLAYNLIMVVIWGVASATTQNLDSRCGPYGFVCVGQSKLRLCEGDGKPSPVFVCPRELQCRQHSAAVCEDAAAASPAHWEAECRRGERVPDMSVPGCKGYVLCVPRARGLHAVRFNCTGNTVFNARSRTCTVPAAYPCPLPALASPASQLYQEDNDALDELGPPLPAPGPDGARPVDCKDYRLSAAGPRHGPPRAAYFCPVRPARAGAPLRCTVFSDHFCLILERDEPAPAPRPPPRRNPRTPHTPR